MKLYPTVAIVAAGIGVSAAIVAPMFVPVLSVQYAGVRVEDGYLTDFADAAISRDGTELYMTGVLHDDGTGANPNLPYIGGGDPEMTSHAGAVDR